jgi:Cu/Zn superoxide dismutase
MLTYFRLIGMTAAILLASVQIAHATPQEHYVAPIFNAGGQQIGNVNFVPQDDGGVEMVLVTSGLPTGDYAMRIRTGTSCHAAGQMIAALPDLVVDLRGNGAVTVYLPSVSVNDANPILGHAVTIGMPAIACGIIGNP